MARERNETCDEYHNPVPLYAASLALIGLAAAALCDAQGIGDGAVLGDTTIALIGIWAGALWLAARREARRLEHLPRPTACPMRRCLFGVDHALLGRARLDRVRALFGQFRLLPGTLPARRTLDKIRCLQWFARRCRAVCVVLTVAAIGLLLVL